MKLRWHKRKPWDGSRPIEEHLNLTAGPATFEEMDRLWRERRLHALPEQELFESLYGWHSLFGRFLKMPEWARPLGFTEFLRQQVRELDADCPLAKSEPSEADWIQNGLPQQHHWWQP